MATAARIVIIGLRTGCFSRPLSPLVLLRFLFDFLSFYVVFLYLKRPEKGVLSSRIELHMRSEAEHVRPRPAPVPNEKSILLVALETPGRDIYWLRTLPFEFKNGID